MSAMIWQEHPDLVGRPLGFLASRSAHSSVGAAMDRVALVAHQERHRERLAQHVERSRRSAKAKADAAVHIGASALPQSLAARITLLQQRHDLYVS